LSENPEAAKPAHGASLEGSVVLVTGGSMGIGYACACAALDAGAIVVIAARGEADLRAAEEQLVGRAGGSARVAAFHADVGGEEDCGRLVGSVLKRFGRLNGMVHAAGVLGPIGNVLQCEPTEWLDTVRVNLFGTFLMAREAARAMRCSGGGRMVLLSGGGATSPFPNYSAYGCSKAGVVRLAETLAIELAPYRIAVNALAPGFVATRMHEQTLAAGERAGADYLRRTSEQLESGGVPVELSARAAVFLLSPRAEGVTGRLLAAPWDDWEEWPAHAQALGDGDLFTLRRIVPRDRGQDWQ
jgi:NAD(P)-dependent dehydrogenase (short-subunit alcohol dehydrogenase family)